MSDPCQNLQCKMEQEIRAIHQAIVGDPQHGHRGLVKRVEVVEEDISIFKSQRSQAEGGWKVLTAIGTAAGVIGGLLVKVLSK